MHQTVDHTIFIVETSFNYVEVPNKSNNPLAGGFKMQPSTLMVTERQICTLPDCKLIISQMKKFVKTHFDRIPY